MPRLFEVLGPHATIHAAEGLPLLGLPPARLSRSSLVAQAGDRHRPLGARRSSLLAPLFARRRGRDQARLARARCSSGRCGWAEATAPFQMLKFRTMAADADERKHEVAHLNKHAERRRPHVQGRTTTRA